MSLTVIGIFALVAAGCQTAGRTGALAGGGIGALAGQAIGRDTESTLIGAAVGAGLVYIIGNEADKKRAAELNKSSEAYGYTHNQVGKLGGTRWLLVSIVPQDRVPPYEILRVNTHRETVTQPAVFSFATCRWSDRKPLRRLKNLLKSIVEIPLLSPF